MTKEQYQQIAAGICNYIHMKDVESIGITCDIQLELAATLTNFVEKAVDKFIAGQREHGGSITDCDLDSAIEEEMIDTFWYTQAKKWQKKNYHAFANPTTRRK